ncbi:MAG: hypothetical protein AAFP84_03415, partial [Actinomycetota bacterium]
MARSKAKRWPLLVTVFSVGVAFVGTATTPSPASAADPLDVLVVTRSATSPPAADQVVIDRLADAGHSVVLLDDHDVSSTPEAAVLDHDVVVVSTTVSAGQIGSAFTDVAVPLITWEPFLHDDLGFGAAGSSGQTPSSSAVRIVDPAHPIADGAIGDVEVTDYRLAQTFGAPAGDVDVIATEARSSARPVVFAYESGAAMFDRPAPARRVGLFPAFATPTAWTDDGAAFFDRAIEWLASGDVVDPVNVAPTVDAGDDIDVVLNGATADVDLSATVDDDGLPVDTPIIAWTGPADVNFDDPNSATPTATLPGPGSFVLTVTVTDTEFTVADTLTVTADEPGAAPVDPAILWVTSSESLTSAEQPAVDRMTADGMTVTVADDDTVTATDAAGADLVVVTSRVSPSKIGDEFADVDVPVLMSEPFLLDDMGMVPAGSTKGQVTGRRHLVVLDPAHDVAAGLTDRVAVLTSRQTMGWGLPTGDVDIV